ncbi:hypothetical protein QUF64_11065 [Anaerolineales bacterium HSG6]|nr:hypothetical protein [Anaerolineales bacterium HSG6]
MSTITLSSETMQELTFVAQTQATSADDLAEKAVQQFLRQLEREKIKREVKTFQQRHDELVKLYLGQYIAMHVGKMVDHDQDFQAITSEFGNGLVVRRFLSVK